MHSVLETATSGDYAEERLYILEAIRRLEKQVDDQLEETGASKEMLQKFKLDLNEAHRRGRANASSLDQYAKRLLTVEVRSAYIAAASGAGIAFVIELFVRFLMHR